MKLLATNGFLDLGEFHPELSTAEAAKIICSELSCVIWRSAETLSVNAHTSKPLNTYAGNFGFKKLPFHTDLAHWYVPPRYLMLRCIVGDPAISTLMVHHRDVIEGISSSVIDRALFRPRRRLDGVLFLVHLIHNGIFRWDQLFLAPDNDEARQVRATFLEHPIPRNVTEINLDTPGRTILIDNWITLHSRSAATGSSTARRIDRVYFSEAKNDS